MTEKLINYNKKKRKCSCINFWFYEIILFFACYDLTARFVNKQKSFDNFGRYFKGKIQNFGNLFEKIHQNWDEKSSKKIKKVNRYT